jgi:hypothetical protein
MKKLVPILEYDDDDNIIATNNFDTYGACNFITLRTTSLLMMLIVRAACALTVVMLIGAALIVAPDLTDFWLYYSHWSLLLLLAMFVISANSSWILVSRQIKNQYPPPVYIRLQRVLFNVACAVNLTSTVAYFIVTFADSHSRREPVNHLVHSINTFLVLVEVCGNMIRLQWTDMFQPLIFTAFYSLFVTVYYRVTGEPVYKYLQWNNHYEMFKTVTGFTILLFFMYMLIIGIQFVKHKCTIKLLLK